MGYRTTPIVFEVSLEKGETLVVGAINGSSEAMPWFFGAEAVLSEYVGREQFVVTGLELSEESLSLIFGDEAEGSAALDVYGLVTESGTVLSGTFLDGYTFVWGVTGDSCVTITEGVITAVAVGSATIYAYVQNNINIYGSCTVTVTQAVSLEPGEYSISVTYTFGDNAIIAVYTVDGVETATLGSEYKVTFNAVGSSGLKTSSGSWSYGDINYTYRAEVKGYSSRGFDIVLPEGADGASMSFVFYYDDSTRVGYLSASTDATDEGNIVAQTTAGDTNKYYVIDTTGTELTESEYYLYASDSIYLLTATVSYTITVE